MSHHHSFNTQPRKHARQVAALQRWQRRKRMCGVMIISDDESHSNTPHWASKAEIANQNIAALEAKGIAA